MRQAAWMVLAALVLVQPACDRAADWQAGRQRGQLGLSLQAPETLDWGADGTIRMAVENQGEATAAGAAMELYLPQWLQFGSVEPEGTEVTLLAGNGTRLTYRFTEPLAAGERRTIIQHVRVPDPRRQPGAAPDAPADTVARAVPEDRLVRARLIDARGRSMGAELQAVLSFRGATPMPTAGHDSPGGAMAMLRGDRVGPVRLGMSLDQLRSEVPNLREMSLAGVQGNRGRAFLATLANGQRVRAVMGARGVERIGVDQAGATTEHGLGVGSQLGQLRAAYGAACVEVLPDERAAVWFNTMPWLTFTLDEQPAANAEQLQQDSALLADTASVVEVWVHERRAPC